MIEGLPEKIEESGMSVTKLIGKAKSQWKRSKAQTVYTDEISKEEQKLFADDYELVRLVLEKIDIDRQINEHIDTILGEHRKYLLLIEKKNAHGEEIDISAECPLSRQVLKE